MLKYIRNEELNTCWEKPLWRNNVHLEQFILNNSFEWAAQQIKWSLNYKQTVKTNKIMLITINLKWIKQTNDVILNIYFNKTLKLSQ